MYVTSETQTNSIITNNQQNEQVNEINDTFQNFLAQSNINEEINTENDPRYVKEKTNEEIIANMEKLFEDIKSVDKTGLTLEELAALEEMLAAIKKEMSKENPDKKEIKAILDKLEKVIAQMQKKINGEAIVEAEDVKEEGSTTNVSSIESRVAKVEKNIKELHDFIGGDTGSKQIYQNSELLAEIEKFQGE